MDIKCPVCAEPWEMDSLHEEVERRNPEKPWYVEEKPDGYLHNTPWLNPKVGKWHDDRIYDKFYQTVRKEFTSGGCKAFGFPHNDTKANPAYAAIYDMMGDDLDGAATFLEDMDYLLDG